MFRQIRDSEAGFTLIELMLVVVIIGILCMLAIPRVLATTAQTKQSEVRLVLKEIYQQQRIFRQENDSYWIPGAGVVASGTSTLAFSPIGISIQPIARYSYSIAGGQTNFTVTAVCGILNDDATVDEWKVDESGAITNIVDDSKT